jgi:hypothetical protein
MTTARERLERVHAVVLGTAMLGAVLWPLARDPPRDGFPLSNYPMFSAHKKGTSARISHVVAVSREGRHRPVTPDLVGTDEVMQAHQTIKIAVKRGESKALCERVAERVGDDPASGDIASLEVRTDVYDVFAYFEGERTPLQTQVHARCPVPGRRPG